MNKREFLKLSTLSLLPLFMPSLSRATTGNSLNAPGMPETKFIETNGITMAVYEKGRGLPVIFCHGFPELAYSWRHQLDSVAAAGFRAIAPDLRGFGLSDKPQDIAAYATTEICDDLVGMMDSMGLEKAVFCGHDWGGFVVDTMALLYPERCAGLIGIGAPHSFRPEHLPPAPLTAEDIVDKAAYNAFMQQKDIPEKLLNGNARLFYKTFFRKNYFTSTNLKRLPADSAERRLDLAAMMDNSKGKQPLFISERDLEFYVQTSDKRGFEGGINWYRAMNTTWEQLGKREQHWGLNIPYLYLWPSEDPINVFGLDVGLEDYIDNLEVHAIEGSGHFVMEEAPEIVSERITDWLTRNFRDRGQAILKTS